MNSRQQLVLLGLVTILGLRLYGSGVLSNGWAALLGSTQAPTTGGSTQNVPEAGGTTAQVGSGATLSPNWQPMPGSSGNPQQPGTNVPGGTPGGIIT